MKRLLTVLFTAGLLFISAPLVSAYNPLQTACSGTSQSAICKQNAQQQANNQNPIAGPHGVLQEATNLIAAIAGIVAVIMIIISGLQFITAGGSIGGQRAGDNPSRAKKARATLASAVIGLVVVALSWSIASFIIQKFIE